MFRALALIASLVGASAFSPRSAVRSSALKMGFETELGAQPPLGFWDPLGLLKEADQARSILQIYIIIIYLQTNVLYSCDISKDSIVFVRLRSRYLTINDILIFKYISRQF